MRWQSTLKSLSPLAVALLRSRSLQDPRLRPTIQVQQSIEALGDLPRFVLACKKITEERTTWLSSRLSRQRKMNVVEIKYFSDVLCVWAYVSQARIDAVKEKFRAAVRIENRFCSVFGDTARKITSTWKDRGGYEGFNAHLRQIAERFPHIEIHPEIWLKTRPPTSASVHLFMTAVSNGSTNRELQAVNPQRAYSIK